MKNLQRHKYLTRRLFSLVLSLVLVIGGLLPFNTGHLDAVEAAGTKITSMAYFSGNDGPIISKSGVGEASYGFVMPIFNGGSASWNDVSDDLSVNVLVNGNWVDIDQTDFLYNSNWGHWSDGGFHGYWFSVSETTYLQLASKANNIKLSYTLEFTNINTATITSMAPTQGPNLTAGVTGGIGFTYPIFNGDSNIPYAAVASDLRLFVRPVGTSQWTSIDNNAASGWIYDVNFGQFTDGGGGYWFTINESIQVKLESHSSGASLIYTLTYNEPVRNSYVLTPYDGTTYTAGTSGEIGVPLPRIDGSAAIGRELDNYIYEININGQWVELSDYGRSGFSYSGNGYNNMSDANQWGYWADYIYGLWFQPIQVDMQIRIGYPLNGQKGGNIGNNYIVYNFIGNPNAPRPDVSDLEDIEIGTPSNPYIAGMNLIWQDEFNGSTLDSSKWNYTTGYYLSNDPHSWGWGNNELQHYTDSSNNVFVNNGSLNLVAFPDPKSFPQDPSRVAPYSSGRITTKDKLDFQYGRVDIRAKLPTGNGIWPALWMLPSHDAYGAWAASGEIDIMEAKGRLPGMTSGAVHFGGQWPQNRYIAGDYLFSNGDTFDSDYHVYTIIWEEDNMKWYVNGEFFFKVSRSQWYSVAAPNNENAPFDQPFYLIMNLAVGGHFDGGLTPDPSDLPATMLVDYVRVYKEDGGGTTHTPVTGISLNSTQGTLTQVGQTLNLTSNVVPANASNKAVNWTSSNSNVATVSNSGQVTAIGNGTAIITASTVDGGYSATALITVNIGTPTTPVSSVNLNQAVVELSTNATYQLVATVLPNNATNKQVHWSVANNNIATISQTGLVTGVAPGTTTVTVTTLDGNKIATATIIVTAPNSTIIIGNNERGIKVVGNQVEFYVNGAVFSDIHYILNNGVQMNIAMTSDGSGNYTHKLNNLNYGDKLDYFFTYNPGNGALDTQWFTYIHGVTTE